MRDQSNRETHQRRGDPVQHVQRCHLRLLDCFASLAMTVLAARRFRTVRVRRARRRHILRQHDLPPRGPERPGCVSAFDDPKVPGVACHISQARTGGVGGSLGLAEDPSRFSISLRQIGPITADIATLGDHEKVYAEHTSVFFKHTNVFRIVDKKRNTLVYLAISDKVIEGSPRTRSRPCQSCPGAARARKPIADAAKSHSRYSGAASPAQRSRLPRRFAMAASRISGACEFRTPFR